MCYKQKKGEITKEPINVRMSRESNSSSLKDYVNCSMRKWLLILLITLNEVIAQIYTLNCDNINTSLISDIEKDNEDQENYRVDPLEVDVTDRILSTYIWMMMSLNNHVLQVIRKCGD